jgi:hypothetical protein
VAHKGCNNAKSDYLAAGQHLGAWAECNRLNQHKLQSRLQALGLPCDLPASIRIARWVYKLTEMANGQVWVRERALQHLSPDWPKCFSA